MEIDNWIPFQKIDWDLLPNQIHVDTRDFYALKSNDVFVHKDKHKFNDRFYYTVDEIRELTQRLYDESGGEAEWRYLQLDTFGDNWTLKYLRFYKMSDNRYIMCNSDNYALSKNLSCGSVLKQHLNLIND